MPDVYELTAEDRAILAFERKWWREQGAKETEIFRVFGMTPARYSQRIAALVYRPEALEVAPDVCRQVQQRLEQRGRRRVARDAVTRAGSRTTAP